MAARARAGFIVIYSIIIIIGVSDIVLNGLIIYLRHYKT